MTGRTDRRFWKHFDALPPAAQKLAREKYALWKRDPDHPSLHFEQRRNGLCVVRVGDHYRTIALRENDVIAWFWAALTKTTIASDFDALPASPRLRKLQISPFSPPRAVRGQLSH